MTPTGAWRSRATSPPPSSMRATDSPAREIARYSRAHGGFHAEGDLTRQRSVWAEPLSTTYRGVTIYETPPPTQGISVLQMLNLLEPYDLSRFDYLGPDVVHHLVQAKQIAFHDRDRLIADP